MKKRTKLYLKLNLVSIFFVAVSFIAVTLAWFVYSGLSTVSTEVTVKAWYIELQKGEEIVSNEIVISLDDIYPGMETMEEEIRIKNLGDSDAQVKYEIVSVRILGEEKDNFVVNDSVSSKYIEDQIAHEYPFHINVDLSKKFILAKTDESVFKVSISWPLDSGDNELDSLWGNAAYKFKIDEQKMKNNDPTYQIRASIKLEIKLSAEQYIETLESSDIPYRLGNEILYDVFENKVCTEESATCIRTNVIDVNNTLGDETVTLLPKVNKNYLIGTHQEINQLLQNQVSTALSIGQVLKIPSTENQDETTYTVKDGDSLNKIASANNTTVNELIRINNLTASTMWNVDTRLMNTADILNVISKDIKESVLVRDGLSDLIIGDLMYEDRIEKVMENAISSQGYFKFLNKFSYFYSTDCYWLTDEYNTDNAFAVAISDDSSMKIYGESKLSNCKVIPVIIAPKYNLK